MARTRRARPKVVDRAKPKVVDRGACGCPKKAYSNQKEARAQAKIATKKTGETIEAYHCRRGHCWHIGHPIGSRPR